MATCQNRQKLRPQHIQMCILAFYNYTYDEISTRLGCHPVTVGQVVNSEPGKEFIAELRGRSVDTAVDVQAFMQAIAPIAQDTLLELCVSGKNEQVRANSAKAILEMAGHTPIKRLEVTKTDETIKEYAGMDPEDIRKELEDLVEPSFTKPPQIH